jgi:hypothetical protein
MTTQRNPKLPLVFLLMLILLFVFSLIMTFITSDINYAYATNTAFFAAVLIFVNLEV